MTQNATVMLKKRNVDTIQIIISLKNNNFTRNIF